MTLAEIAAEIAEFTEVRGWKNDNPTHLLVALNTELGELSEHFLWQSKFSQDLTPDQKREIGYEMVDVLIYLLQIANKSGIPDLGELYADKIKKLAIKYPIGVTDKEWRERREEYKRTGKNKLYQD